MKYSFLYYLLIPAIIIVQLSCSDSDLSPNMYEGRHFEIAYSRTDTFNTNDWIQIDSTRFTHYRHPSKIMQDSHGIPASVIVKDSVSPDRVFEANFNSISIAIELGNKLVAIGREDSSSKGTYVISNKPLLMTHGRIWFHRNDSSEITIKTSEDYPARIKELELD